LTIDVFFGCAMDLDETIRQLLIEKKKVEQGYCDA
jgi:hypothetical protein